MYFVMMKKQQQKKTDKRVKVLESQEIYEAKYSRMDQAKFVKDSH